MSTLTVFRDWQSAYNQTTTLVTKDGKVRKIINSSLQQPKKKDKTININGITYLLNWQNVK
jgi:hypothetical protein